MAAAFVRPRRAALSEHELLLRIAAARSGTSKGLRVHSQCQRNSGVSDFEAVAAVMAGAAPSWQLSANPCFDLFAQ